MAQPQGQNRTILVVLAIFFPWVSVLLLKGCVMETVITFLLTCLFWIPGFLYALYIIFQDPNSDAPIGYGLNQQLQEQQQSAPAQSYQHRAEAQAQAAPASAAPTQAAPVAAAAPITEAPVAEAVPEKSAAAVQSVEPTEPAPAYPAEKQ